MRVIAKRTIRQFWETHPLYENALKNWYKIVSNSGWKKFSELKGTFSTTDYVGNDRYVFDVKGNDIRVVGKIDFDYQLVFIRFIGTHTEYDRMNKRTGAKNV